MKHLFFTMPPELARETWEARNYQIISPSGKKVLWMSIRRKSFWNNSENRASGTCSNVACTNFAAEKLSVGTSFRKFKSKRWQENTAEVRAKDGNTLKVQARGNAPRIASPKKDTKATPHLRMWQHGTMEYTNECQRKQLYAEVCSRRNMMQRTSITNPWL